MMERLSHGKIRLRLRLTLSRFKIKQLSLFQKTEDLEKSTLL